MGLKLPAATTPKDLQSPSFMGKVLDQAKTTVTNETITDDSFAPRTGNTVIGRATNSAGKPADIGLAPNQFLANRSGTIVGTTIADTDIPATIARDTEITAAIATHTGLADPHTQYRLESVNVPWTEVSGKPAWVDLHFSGTGSPEGVVAAPVSSHYHRTDGGTGTSFYVKETGAATSTGWVAK
jgi:hypothetical protein